MSTYQRTVYLNPVEPQPISVRAPAATEALIDFTFRDQNGQVLTTDLAAQLHLTGRSGRRTSSYAVPSIDVVNGKARAVIPREALSDMNGYRMQLYGTVRQQIMLLGTGLLSLIPATGLDPMPPDTIDTIDIVLAYSTPTQIGVKLWQDDDKNTVYNIDQVVITASIFDSAQATLQLVPFTVVKIPPNMATLTLTAEEVNLLPPGCWWELRASQSGTLTTLAQGNVTVTGTKP